MEVIEQQPCGFCAGKLHRSKVRNLYERFRKMRTPLRPFQCNDCGWRGWLPPLQWCGPAGAVARSAEAVDLTSLDGLFAGNSPKDSPAPPEPGAPKGGRSS